MKRTAYGLAILALVSSCSDGAPRQPAAGSGGTASGGTASGGAGVSDGGSTVNSGGNVATGGTSSSGGRTPSSGGTTPSSGGESGSGGVTTPVDAGVDGGEQRREPYKGVANSPCTARTALGATWYYNWMQRENEPCADGRGGEFVPMVWGHTGAEQTDSGIRSAVASFIDAGYGYVLGFNEPDNTGQSNLAVDKAISLVPAFVQAGIRVGTPATQANTSGQAWFKDYMGKIEANPALRQDFIAVHWYGWNAGSCDAKASQLESYIRYAEGFAGNRPIWLTEWGCLNQSAPTAEGVVAFYEGAVAMLARHPRVQRYAWYPWSMNCGLNEKDGSLTSLGQAFAKAPAYR